MKPQYITDAKGKRISVIVPINDYEKMLQELENKEDVQLYDEAKKMIRVNEYYFLIT